MATLIQPSRLTVGTQLELGVVDSDGTEWAWERITGWHKPAEMIVARTQRYVRHGEFSQDGHRTGRVITITGWLYSRPKDRFAMNAAINKINAVLADGGTDTFTFYDSDYFPLHADVQLLDFDGDWGWGRRSDFYDWQIQLLAPDPYKYGAALFDSTGFYVLPAGVGLRFPLFAPSGALDFNTDGVTAGTLALDNPGTAEAVVDLIVSGPTPDGGFTITDLGTGRKIIWNGAVVPAGSFLRFNGHDGSVSIDDVADRAGDAVIQGWPTVPAGGELDLLFTANGPVTAAVLSATAAATYS